MFGYARNFAGGGGERGEAGRGGERERGRDKEGGVGKGKEEENLSIALPRGYFFIWMTVEVKNFIGGACERGKGRIVVFRISESSLYHPSHHELLP